MREYVLPDHCIGRRYVDLNDFQEFANSIHRVFQTLRDEYGISITYKGRSESREGDFEVKRMCDDASEQDETLRATTDDCATREAELRMMVKFLFCMVLHEKCLRCSNRNFPELCGKCWVRTITSDVRKLGVDVDDD